MIDNIYCSCEEHIGYVIDDFINTYELVPNIEFDRDNNYCNYCNKYAKDIVMD